MRNLITSERFITYVLSLAVLVFVTLVPELAELEDALLAHVVELTLILVAAPTLFDGIGTWLNRPGFREDLIDTAEYLLGQQVTLTLPNGTIIDLDLPDSLEAPLAAEIVKRVYDAFGVEPEDEIETA